MKGRQTTDVGHGKEKEPTPSSLLPEGGTVRSNPKVNTRDLVICWKFQFNIYPSAKAEGNCCMLHVVPVSEVHG
jgi:hypothetical protein